MVYVVYDESLVLDFANKHGYWVSAGVEQSIGWPVNKIIVYFRERPILLIPSDKNKYPTAAIYYEKHDSSLFEKAQIIILDFLSSLSWVEDRPITVKGWATGMVPGSIGIDINVNFINNFFSLNYLPDPPAGSKPRLALALYREAISLNHYAYKFLSFFKILNLHEDHQKKWINRTLSKVTDLDARNRKEELLKLTQDVGEYLYTSGRCAIAHATLNKNHSVVVNPDDPKDFQRLVNDMPLIKDLARIAIQEMGVQTFLQAYDEHLYELAGFKKLFGAGLINKLQSGLDIKISEIPTFPQINIRLRRHSPFESLKSLNVEVIEVSGGKIVLNCYRDNKLIHIYLVLDFINEHLIFDPSEGYIVNEISSQSDAELCADFCCFMINFWANGELEIWDFKNELLLGCKDAFIPKNFDPSKTIKIIDEFRCKYKEIAMDFKSP